ncbi:tyrosine-type recombinase/integrase [Thiomicrolovo sp. ZZH C-3]
MAIKRRKSLQNDVRDYDLSETGSLSGDIDLWVERFKLAEQRTEKTQRSYMEALKPFTQFCDEYDGEISIEEVGSKFINNYIVYYIEYLADFGLEKGKIDEDEHRVTILSLEGDHGMNDSGLPVPKRYRRTVKHRLTVLKMLLRYITKENKQKHDFIRHFQEVVKVSDKGLEPQPHLTDEEMESLILVAYDWPTHYYRTQIENGREFSAWRYSFLVLIYVLTAMRASEARYLRLGDFTPFMKKLKDGSTLRMYSISVKMAKGDKTRNVLAPARILDRHLSYFKELYGGDPERYIAARSPKENVPVSYKSLYIYSARIFVAAGIDSIRCFHPIRRGWATKMVSLKKPGAIISRIMGHSSFATTHEHYIIPSEQAMAEVYDDDDWVGVNQRED